MGERAGAFYRRPLGERSPRFARRTRHSCRTSTPMRATVHHSWSKGESQRAFVVAAGTPECAGMLGRHLPPGCVTHQHFARSRKPIMVDVAERVRSLKQRNTRSRNAARSV